MNKYKQTILHIFKRNLQGGCYIFKFISIFITGMLNNSNSEQLKNYRACQKNRYQLLKTYNFLLQIKLCKRAFEIFIFILYYVINDKNLLFGSSYKLLFIYYYSYILTHFCSCILYAYNICTCLHERVIKNFLYFMFIPLFRSTVKIVSQPNE